MIRTVFAISILAACVLFGYHFASKLSERPRIISAYLSLLDAAASRMQYTHDDLSAVFSENFAGYSFRHDCAFSDQWMEMITRYNSVLKDDDFQVLAKFAQGLGASDLESQMKHISLYKTLLTERLEDAKREQENKANLYRILPFSVGLTLAILLL